MTTDEDILLRVEHRAADSKTRNNNADIRVNELPPPLTEEELANVERRLGFGLPPFLALVYCRIANGGFGPGYGLLPLTNQPCSSDEPSALQVYEELAAKDASDPEWEWPRKLLPLCDWGCAIYSCIDCSTPAGLVVTCDPGQRQTHEAMSKALVATQYSFAAWVDAWACGIRLWDTMFEDSADSLTMVNPFTGEPFEVRKRILKRE